MGKAAFELSIGGVLDKKGLENVLSELRSASNDHGAERRVAILEIRALKKEGAAVSSAGESMWPTQMTDCISAYALIQPHFSFTLAVQELRARCVLEEGSEAKWYA